MAPTPRKTIFHSQSDAYWKHLAETQAMRESLTKDICFKVFIIATVVLATVAIIAGVLAVLAARGNLPGEMSSISSLSLIGEVNSYLMLGGGITLFVLGILAWSCNIRNS